MPSVDDLAAVLPGRAAARRALVLWRRLIDDPPTVRRVIARDLGVSEMTVINDERVSLNELCRRRDDPAVRSAIPEHTRLHAAIFESRAQTAADQRAAIWRARSVIWRERRRWRG